MLNISLKSIKKSNLFSRYFSNVIPSTEFKSVAATLKKPTEVISETSKQSLGLTQEEINIAVKTGADLVLNKEKKTQIDLAGFFFRETNNNINLDQVATTGWKLKYLKNMLLLQDYSNIFRDFLQSCCLRDENGLKLTCEDRLKDVMNYNLKNIVKFGYNFELDSLKILYDFKLLRVELYKNLKINRDTNKDFNAYDFKHYSTPIAPLVIAHEKGNDHSLAKDNRPFIIATTMLIRTPMKIAIFNQNMKRKIYGYPEDEVMEYVVRFETEASPSELMWILPTQNKPKRLRLTKITDFNNVLRGNPFFQEKFDLINENKRFDYMTKDRELDSTYKNMISSRARISSI